MYYEIKIAENGHFYYEMAQKFPNGFKQWRETYYEVVQYINSLEEGYVKNGTIVEDVRENEGTSGLYDLADKWTDEFETIHKDTEWESESVGMLETLEQFLDLKNIPDGRL